MEKESIKFYFFSYSSQNVNILGLYIGLEKGILKASQGL